MLLDHARFSLLAWLEDHADTFVAEGSRIPHRALVPWPQVAASIGTWQGLPLLDRGSGHPLPLDLGEARRLAPRSAALLDERPEVVTAAFSVLPPGARILSHVDEKPAGSLRAHLGIVVPRRCGLRIADRLVRWSRGRSLVFDGSIDHETANLDVVPRVVLLVDFRLTPREAAYRDAFLEGVEPRWFEPGAGAGLFDASSLLAT